MCADRTAIFKRFASARFAKGFAKGFGKGFAKGFAKGLTMSGTRQDPVAGMGLLRC
jgi:hypothetical protein